MEFRLFIPMNRWAMISKFTIQSQNAMVIGYDAYHDKATRGAVVSSMNQAWTKYLSQVGLHKNQEDLTDNFATGVKSEYWSFLFLLCGSGCYVLCGSGCCCCCWSPSCLAEQPQGVRVAMATNMWSPAQHTPGTLDETHSQQRNASGYT